MTLKLVVLSNNWSSASSSFSPVQSNPETRTYLNIREVVVQIIVGAYLSKFSLISAFGEETPYR